MRRSSCQAAGRRKNQRAARAVQELPSSRRSSMEPRKITVKSTLRASHAMAHAPLLTLIFHGSFGACNETLVDGLPADGMQEVWGSNPHSSTGQKHNSKKLALDSG
jgi:hypothetical protein